MELPLDPDTGREIKPLRAADYRFKVKFRCDDPQCTSHEFSILDWEMDALYFKRRTQDDRSPHTASQDVVAKLRDQVCAPDKDLHFFLGNFHSRPWQFSVVGLWWPKKKLVDPQGKLF
jgi:hypothetical protein